MDEDPRDVELSTITAIFPELQIDENNPYKLSIGLPVSLEKPLTVLFPAATEATPPVAPSQVPIPAPTDVDSQALSNLPALQVNITLPNGYPHEKPPIVSIFTSPPWLSDEILRRLERSATKLWEEIGRDQVIFTYIDELQSATEDVFGLVNSRDTLEVGLEHKIALLDYDMNAKRKAFEKETFECGICLDPKKGTVCHKMLDCGHVFCIQCLQDFYNNAIMEGDIAAVTCLTPNCAREREKNFKQESALKRRKPKTFISPSELLQIPIDQEMVKRFVMLKHKTELESDKNTVYCPRSWCQGAARSKRHKKPEGFELADSDDEEDEDMGLLAICEDCGFAFCSRCGQSWHGEFKYCIPKERKDAITEEEQASLEYLKMHSTPCPTCAAPCQKSHGCNHMRCFRCQTHFCYLCSAWLDPSNPYRHFNTQPSGQVTSCYMRLWELEGGDGDDVGIAYEGGDAQRNANVAPGHYGEHLEIVGQRQAVHRGQREPGNEEQQALAPREPAREPGQLQQPQQPPQLPRERRAVVAREGPLVLRIEGDAPPPRDAARANAQVLPVAPPRANAGQRGAHGGNRRGRGGAGAIPQNGRNRTQGQARPNNNAARVRQVQPVAAAAVGRNGQQNNNRLRVDEVQNPNDLNPQQEAWIRQFVQLALNDQEDIVDWDSDDE
ncbi:RWD-domain-containing protein [Xylariaceae sp. FL1651]|nr:RWD-domain-containing protein [Xylariaceae sp. FL1651]